MTTVEIEVRITGPVGSRKSTMMKHIKRIIGTFGSITKESTAHINNNPSEVNTSEICSMELKLDLTRL